MWTCKPYLLICQAGAKYTAQTDKQEAASMSMNKELPAKLSAHHYSDSKHAAIYMSFPEQRRKKKEKQTQTPLFRSYCGCHRSKQQRVAAACLVATNFRLVPLSSSSSSPLFFPCLPLLNAHAPQRTDASRMDDGWRPRTLRCCIIRPIAEKY